MAPTSKSTASIENTGPGPAPKHSSASAKCTSAPLLPRPGQPDDWPKDVVDGVYGPETGPARCYPQDTPMSSELRLPSVGLLVSATPSAIADMLTPTKEERR